MLGARDRAVIHTKSGARAYAGRRPQHQQITVYNHQMAKDVIHISEAEAASDFASLMARVRAGAKVIIENGARPVAVLHAAEPVYGAYRTKTPAQQQRRLEFIERLSSDVPVHPVTLAIARLAGRIEGQQEAMGIQFAFEDLLIGATALHLGYEVATLNLRDFQRIPGLSVIQF